MPGVQMTSDGRGRAVKPVNDRAATVGAGEGNPADQRTAERQPGDRTRRPMPAPLAPSVHPHIPFPWTPAAVSQAARRESTGVTRDATEARFGPSDRIRTR